MNLLCSRNQTVTIDFISYGDGGHSHYLFVYHPTPQPRLLVRTTGETFLPPPYPHLQLAYLPRSPRVLAEILLAPAQVQRLVNLIRYYRTQHKGTSTQHTAATITWHKGSQTLASEYHQDQSSFDSFLEDADPRDLRALKLPSLPLLSLSQVAEQAEKAYQRQQKRVPFRELPREETWAARQLRYRQEEAQNRVQGEKTAKRLAGFSTVTQRYQLSDFNQGNYFVLESEGLYVSLKPRTSECIDQFDWYDPVVKGAPRFNWHTFLQRAALVNHWAASLPWLDEWKRAAPGRTIQVSIYGEAFLSPDSLLGDRAPQWKKAGLSGTPAAELRLERRDRSHLDLLLQPDEPRTLLFVRSPSKSETEQRAHPLDSLDPKSAREGIVVTAEGKPRT